MTLYLENVSENKTITIRYGNGNNLMLQINAKCKKPLPLEITKQKLQSYLHLFKSLRLVEDKKEDKVKNENNDSISVQNVSSNIVEGEQTGSENKLPESENELSEEETNNNEQEDTNGEIDPDRSKIDGAEEQFSGQIVGDGSEGESSIQSSGESEKSDGEVGSDNKPELTIYTEKELYDLKADQVKEVARLLGIEVTSESTKKGLIPIILNKQEELK